MVTGFVLDIGDFTIYHGCKEFSSNSTKLQIITQNQPRKVNTVVLDNTNALGEPPTLCTGPAVVDLMANHAKVVNNSYDHDFLLRRSAYVHSDIDMHKMDSDVCLRVK